MSHGKSLSSKHGSQKLRPQTHVRFREQLSSTWSQDGQICRECFGSVQPPDLMVVAICEENDGQKVYLKYLRLLTVDFVFLLPRNISGA